MTTRPKAPSPARFARVLSPLRRGVIWFDCCAASFTISPKRGENGLIATPKQERWNAAHLEHGGKGRIHHAVARELPCSHAALRACDRFDQVASTGADP